MNSEEILSLEKHLAELEVHIAYIRERISRIRAGEIAVGFWLQDQINFRIDNIEDAARKLSYLDENSIPETSVPGPYFCKVVGGDDLKTKDHDVLQDALNEVVWNVLGGEGLPLTIEVFQKGSLYRTFEVRQEEISQYRLIPKEGAK